MSEILQNLTILFVEDENETRKLMEDVLKYEFAKVIVAQNGDEGLKKFKKYTPDIVVSDIAMPILDGLDMSKAIKEISPSTPIVLLSAYSEKEKLLKAIELGVDKYILKPIDMDEFLLSLAHIASSKISSTCIVDISKEYKFDKTKRILIKKDKEITLTKKELAFVSLLVKRLGTVVLHEEIKDVVWIGESVTEAAIRTFVKRIRDKTDERFIKNAPGLGYKIDIE
ncbi:response regulator transcription factor [Campylobacter pinnipediorum]|uniref:CheY-P-specific phosphatase CheX n=1 Tax=Campylobacter pinnipediorum subsp. pinnipediorum TaxID=1660067 RepID=A0AAX0LBZ1_9BACT|nr:response regulator transcription factor [Campylobacter pinnipediorum]AQW82315.1 two-component system response regulator [Campylobacter pinnipediorum subsp. pinnipediorum]AQW83992.1 two-component system response regulator [Campylobacter pinnipediorum subsp. pinnipediorum]OPA76581.1 CheY-P-specific phosphatase CheX [Campylobacter pinnipediorum subsp. pinnipediorum]OPA82026.1 CheY-P-specific phosphatase CheX [Campylobacter pinnipediorum subsp. pinnipediorum]